MPHRAAAALAGVVVVVATAMLVTASGRTGTRVAGPGARRGLLGSTAVWSVVAELHAPGPNGQSPAGGPIELGSIACTAGGAACVAVGGPFVARRAAGTGWTVRAAPAGAGFLTSVSCGGGENCVAVAQPSGGIAGDLVVTTADAGITWRARRVPAVVAGLSAVACPTATRCTAVGESRGGAVAVRTSDAGATWAVVRVPAELAGLDGIGCSQGPFAVCVAVGWLPGRGGAAIGVLRAGNPRWSVVRAPPGVGSLGTVDCPTRAVCYAGGFQRPASSSAPGRHDFPGALAVTTDGGRQWRLAELPAVAGPVDSISCAGPVACVVAGVSAAVGSRRLDARLVGPPGMAISTGDGGRHWQVDVLPATASGVADVSCVGAAVAPSCTATAAGPASSTLLLTGSSAG